MAIDRGTADSDSVDSGSGVPRRGERPSLSGYWVFAALVTLMLLAGAAVDRADLPRWIYRRSAILDGEVWRLVTGQLVHANGRHLLWNLATLLLIGIALGRLATGARWLAIAAASAAGAGLGPLLLSPETQATAGASALLHGLFAGVAAIEIRRGGGAGWWLAGALALKLAVEQLAGPMTPLTVGLGGGIAVDAHLWGAAGGLLAGLSPPRPRAR